MIYRPVRERDPDEIVDTIVSAMEKGGYDEIGLTTLSTADYSCISPLIKKVMAKLRPARASLSVASLRAYGLDEDLFDEIRSVRATGLTFAPEAGTQRMRDVVNKNISEEDLSRTAHRVFERGWRRMKLYFMIGLPTETDEDVAGIMETGRRMKRIGANYHPARAVGITVSVSSHVPKPHTPFQWCAIDTVDEIERKQDMLHHLARRYRLEFRRHDSRVSFLECILGRGDRRVADLIETAWRAGARFDSWGDQFRWKIWVDAMERHPEIPYDLFLGTLPTDARLPWDHLDMQLTDRFLVTEYRRSMKGKLSPPCGKPVGAQVHHSNLAEHEEDRRILVCYHCGVECDMTAMREERGEFLEKLGALQPSPSPLPSSEPALPNPTPHRPEKYRIVYAKTGVAALTGHLDLVRVVPRVLRRAGLRVRYSEGFHPKPVMEFAPPLPLGVAGLGEVVDLALDEPVDPGEFLARLRRNAPAGLVFRTVSRVPEGARKLSRVLTGAEYLVRVDAEHLAEFAHSDVDLDDLPARFLALSSVPWDVLRKRKPKSVDLRPAVDQLEWVDPRALPEELASWRDATRVLRVRVKLEGDAHARPEEVAAAMLGKDPGFEGPHLVRVRLLLRDDKAAVPAAPAPALAST
jgi:radical SAM-linked protein